MALLGSMSKNVPRVCVRFNLTRLSQEQTHTEVSTAYSQLETICSIYYSWKHRNVSVDSIAYTVFWMRGLTAWRDSWNFSSTTGPFRDNRKQLEDSLFSIFFFSYSGYYSLVVKSVLSTIQIRYIILSNNLYNNKFWWSRLY